MVKRDNYRRLMGDLPLKTGHFLPINYVMSRLPIPDFYIDDVDTEYLLHEVVLPQPAGTNVEAHAGCEDEHNTHDDAHDDDYQNEAAVEPARRKRKRNQDESTRHMFQTLTTTVSSLQQQVAQMQGVKREGVKVEQTLGMRPGTAPTTSAAHPVDLVSSGSETPSDEESDAISSREHKCKKRKMASNMKSIHAEHNALKRRKQGSSKPGHIANYTKRKQLRNGAKRNWRGSMKRNSYLEKIRADVAECTVDSLPEAVAMMRKAGWALLRNYDKIVRRVPIREGDDDYDHDERVTVQETGSVFTAGNAPSANQAAYPRTGSFDGTVKKPPPSEHIFAGVRVETNSYEYSAMRSKQLRGEDNALLETENVPRQVLKPNSSGLKAYNDHYIGQMSDIIQGMFAEEGDINGHNPAADPENWHFVQNVVWGGTEHQHQHCDQGQAGSFHYEQIFPFVCIHGFGVNEYNMWLLPARMKREYGFPYRFPAKSMLFMRGDFVHAGGCSQAARAHLEFFPTAKAGWTKTKYPYWGTKKQFDESLKKKNTFLVPDLHTFPFAYPNIREDSTNGSLIVSYPNTTEDDDLFPQLKKPKRSHQ
jgi:hypothetical protein